MEKRCVQLEEVDKDSSGLWGGESQTPPKETSVERETPPSSDTPHVVETPPSNSSTTPPLVETPPSSDTPHVVEIPPSNSSTTPPVVAVETPPSDSGTNRDPASSGEAVTKQLKRALTLCTEDNTPVLKRNKRMKGRHMQYHPCGETQTHQQKDQQKDRHKHLSEVPAGRRRGELGGM